MTIIAKLDAIANTLATELPLLRDSGVENHGDTLPASYDVFVPFFWTVNKRWWYNDSTQWLTVDTFRMTATLPSASVTTTIDFGAVPDAYKIAVTDLAIDVTVSTVNNLSNNWVLNVWAVPRPSGTAITVHSSNTGLFAPGVPNRVIGANGVTQLGNIGRFQIRFSNSFGTPGMISAYAMLECRHRYP